MFLRVKKIELMQILPYLIFAVIILYAHYMYGDVWFVSFIVSVYNYTLYLTWVIIIISMTLCHVSMPWTRLTACSLKQASYMYVLLSLHISEQFKSQHAACTARIDMYICSYNASIMLCNAGNFVSILGTGLATQLSCNFGWKFIPAASDFTTLGILQ